VHSPCTGPSHSVAVDDVEQRTLDTTTGNKEGSSLIAQVSWSVDGVCAWLKSLAEQQDSGQPSHPDDIRAGEQATTGSLDTTSQDFV